MIDAHLTTAAQHIAKWLETGDERERDIGMDAFREAAAGESVVAITRALPGFVDCVNAMLGHDMQREVH